MNNYSVLKYFSFFQVIRFDKVEENSVNAVQLTLQGLFEQLPIANLFELIQRRFTTVGDYQYVMVQCIFPKDEEGKPLNFDRIMGFPLGDDLLFDEGDDPDDLGGISEIWGDDN
jgi:hypothetical protein